MRPDGGIIWAQFGETKDGVFTCTRKYPVFIGEDKVQGLMIVVLLKVSLDSLPVMLLKEPRRIFVDLK